ncbi:MAG: cyclase family protein [Salinarimonas sp.]
MCTHCVMESVKRRMMSRRDFFRRAATGSVAAAAATSGIMAAAPAARAQGAMRVEDMTHELFPEFPTYFGEQQFFVEEVFNWDEHMFNLNVNTINEHTGTHIDAPLHFSEDGQSVAEIPLSNLVVPLAIIDIREKADADPDAQVTPDDLRAWIEEHGPLPENCCVAMNSGWDAFVNDAKFRNADDDGVMHFPGFHVEAAQMLIEETGAIGMAVDTLSLDYGPSQDFATHYEWLPTNRWGLECIANLGALPATGATLVLGAPKIRGGTGGPSRVFAML